MVFLCQVILSSFWVSRLALGKRFRRYLGRYGSYTGNTEMIDVDYFTLYNNIMIKSRIELYQLAGYLIFKVHKHYLCAKFQ